MMVVTAPLIHHLLFNYFLLIQYYSCCVNYIRFFAEELLFHSKSSPHLYRAAVGQNHYFSSSAKLKKA